MKKLRFKEAKQLSEGHAEREGRSWDANQGSLAPCFPRESTGDSPLTPGTQEKQRKECGLQGLLW